MQCSGFQPNSLDGHGRTRSGRCHGGVPACLFLWDRCSRSGFAQALQGAWACLSAQHHPEILVDQSMQFHACCLHPNAFEVEVGCLVC